MGLAAQSSAASALVSKAERDTMSRSRLRSDPPVVAPNPSPDYNYKKGLHTGDLFCNWSGQWDSDPRHQPWQGCALPLSYTRIL